MKKLKKALVFFFFFVLWSIIAVGIAVRFSLYGNQDTINGYDYVVSVINSGFFPIFGKYDIYSESYLKTEYLMSSYTRESCLAKAANSTVVTNASNSTVVTNASDDINACPYKSGVIFTMMTLVVYLIIMNLIFLNLLIATFG